MLIFGLDEVHPLEGEFPPITADEVSGLPERMRRILKDCSLEELDRLMFMVNEMLASDAALSEDRAAIERMIEIEEAGESGEQVTSPPPGSEARPLIVCMDHFELPTSEWSKAFAVFSLSLLNEAAQTENALAATLKDPETDWKLLYRITPWTTAAVEAGAYAEVIHRAGTSNTSGDTRKISIQHQIAGKQRHAKTHRAIRDLKKRYINGDYPSLAAAVRDFCKAEPDKVSHLAPTNRERTLREGLSNQLRDGRG